ncbi:MAG: SGNH/GDSL hydrolase family protein [Vagococcus sp.]
MRKIILFGDSITAGYEKGEIDTRLNELIMPFFPEYDVVNAGIPGDTTKDALKRVKAHVCQYNPEYVTVFFGANDVSKTRYVSEYAFEKNLETIIQQIGIEKVILIGVPYADQLIYEKEHPIEKIRLYNMITRRIAREKDIPFINMLEFMLSEKDPRVWLQSDGLHFSEKGYMLLGSQIVDALKKKEGK